MIGTNWEITAQKHAEAQLRDSEERYRTAFQMNLDSVDICHLEDGRFVDVNDAFLLNTGFAREEVIGRTALELGIWANPADRQNLLEALRVSSACRNLEAQYRIRDGTLRWGLLSVSKVELDGVPCILSVTRDITDAKAAEERLAAAQQALSASEVRYRTVFQTSQEGIALTRMSDGKCIDANSALLNMLGYEYDEFLSRTTSELSIWVDPDARAEWVARLQRAPVFRDIRIRLRKKSGEVFWSLMSSSVIQIDGHECILTMVRDISEAKAAEEEIRSLAFYDTLTGVPNRRLATERLQHAIVAAARANRKGGLLFIDLDHFKQLNDTLGHKAGDVLLKEVARRLKLSVRESDTVGRFAGDEFVVVLHDLSEHTEEARAQVQAIADKILKSIHHPCLIEGHETMSSCSVGITLFGNHDDTVDNILQQADIAMYQAKTAGRNALRFFAPALQVSVNARATLEEDLRQAIRLNHFELYYQPQFDRDELVGAEALIRWNHSSRGVIPPDEFIPLAEETGLILEIGNWVLETACAQIAGLTQYEQCANITVAVNISAREFRQPDFVERVLSAVFSSNANPRRLKLELTESMLVDNLADVIAKMTELKANGIKFSLDDFGTGYSSLSYLKRLPLDQLKIDRSFVRDMLDDDTSGAIARTIISLSKAMGLSVIAEGVETEEQREFLAEHGCISYQGYLFGRPVPFEEFQELCRALPGTPRERLSVIRSGRR
jgi:diguanylate cyclase (GGDEF)-like protein/PAS domain S-box-containing protein